MTALQEMVGFLKNVRKGFFLHTCTCTHAHTLPQVVAEKAKS